MGRVAAKEAGGGLWMAGMAVSETGCSFACAVESLDAMVVGMGRDTRIEGRGWQVNKFLL